ncbi:MAG: hypothetical protein VKJ86_06710 [Synechococcus sp.]|nr:hypothetical protein [Synechococcus sp.]
MAVAPRPWQVAPARPKKSRPLTVVRPTVQPLPSRLPEKAVPPLLQTLYLGKHVTQWVAIASVAAAMGLYAGKAYSQKTWSESFEHLLQLQEYETHLVATSAGLEEYFREQADGGGSGLVSPTPAHSLYIPQPTRVSLPEPPTVEATHPREQSPIGY